MLVRSFTIIGGMCALALALVTICWGYGQMVSKKVRADCEKNYLAQILHDKEVQEQIKNNIQKLPISERRRLLYEWVINEAN